MRREKVFGKEGALEPMFEIYSHGVFCVVF